MVKEFSKIECDEEMSGGVFLIDWRDVEEIWSVVKCKEGVEEMEKEVKGIEEEISGEEVMM